MTSRCSLVLSVVFWALASYLRRTLHYIRRCYEIAPQLPHPNEYVPVFVGFDRTSVSRK